MLLLLEQLPAMQLMAECKQQLLLLLLIMGRQQLKSRDHAALPKAFSC